MNEQINLLQGDCLQTMKEIPDGSVDMILTDPPYGTMKNISQKAYKSPSDFGWDSCIDHKEMLTECNRVLRPNGCLILFSQDPYTGKLMTETHGNLPFSYRMTWHKNSFGNVLMCNKAPVSYTEDVCVFFKKYEDKTGHPLQSYFSDQLALSKVTRKEVCDRLGTSHASHFFTKGIQFRTPNEVYLKQLQEMTGLFDIQYSEVEATQRLFLKEKRDRYPTIFNLPDGKKYKSNVLKYSKDKGGVHPTQKPVALLEDLINTYTNEGQTVLDFTMGSGSTGVAARNLGRSFIGIELDVDYFAIASTRINNEIK